jgi:hypothetical protein
VLEEGVDAVVGRIGAAAFDGKLEQDGAHLRQQGTSLVDGEGAFGGHGQPRW